MKKPSIKKPNIKNILPKWSSKNIRKGSYSLGISVVVLAIAVVFNLVVGKLPSQYRNVDLSQTKLSTIGRHHKRAGEQPGSGCDDLSDR